MSDTTMPLGHAGSLAHKPKLDGRPPRIAIFVFLSLLAAGLIATLYGLTSDLSDAGGQPLAISAFVLLAIALLIALGFEFVNGFHDTANAVATVIYTHAMPAQIAVLWSRAALTCLACSPRRAPSPSRS
jgi:inorganic phosphate transporter, PiT family